jgi:hypothetical protein
MPKKCRAQGWRSPLQPGAREHGTDARCIFIFDTVREIHRPGRSHPLNIRSSPWWTPTIPTWWIIPFRHDDALRSIDLICKLAGEAIDKSVAEYSRIAAEESRRRPPRAASQRAAFAARAASGAEKRRRGLRRPAKHGASQEQ